MIRGATLIGVAMTALSSAAMAKTTQLWNLTANTITSLQLSPAGKNEWGPDQTANDPDHAVDHDERLKITGAPPGLYDVKFVDKTGRTCIVENIEIKQGAIVSIEEKRLENCSK
jgi:hypothetical protein